MGFKVIEVYKTLITCISMRLGELLNKVKNSRNNQSVWNPKKRKLKELKIKEEDLLNMKVDLKLKKLLIE